VNRDSAVLLLAGGKRTIVLTGNRYGACVYVGLMLTAGAVYWFLHFFHITVDIRNVCVLLAPMMAANTAMVTYLFTKEVWNTSAGVLAAAFVAIVPGTARCLLSRCSLSPLSLSLSLARSLCVNAMIFCTL